MIVMSHIVSIFVFINFMSHEVLIKQLCNHSFRFPNSLPLKFQPSISLSTNWLTELVLDSSSSMTRSIIGGYRNCYLRPRSSLINRGHAKPDPTIHSFPLPIRRCSFSGGKCVCKRPHRFEFSISTSTRPHHPLPFPLYCQWKMWNVLLTRDCFVLGHIFTIEKIVCFE